MNDRRSPAMLIRAATQPDRDCVISRLDLETLLAGTEAERERGYRNLFAGVAAIGALGAVSTVTSHFGELLSVGIGPLESLFLTLLGATTLAASALAAFFHQRVRRSEATDPRLLGNHIRQQLEQPTDPDDPRRWP